LDKFNLLKLNTFKLFLTQQLVAFYSYLKGDLISNIMNFASTKK